MTPILEKTKVHILKHREIYCFVVGVGFAGFTFIIVRGTIAQRGMGIGIAQRGIINTVSQFFITNIVNQEYGGKACRNVETGNVFLSQRKAAKAFGGSEGILSRHLQGKEPDFCGLHFERINLDPA
jgi:hypothetical protein